MTPESHSAKWIHGIGPRIPVLGCRVGLWAEGLEVWALALGVSGKVGAYDFGFRVRGFRVLGLLCALIIAPSRTSAEPEPYILSLHITSTLNPKPWAPLNPKP